RRSSDLLAQNIAVVLGPGVNIKRNPLCGRNFEYYSEDPLLSGKMGAAFIRGVQSRGVGTSLKHYAVNNQETDRLIINAVVDARTLHELYFKPFEIAVRESKPYTIMCSYNRINGTYSSDNDWLLNRVLREQWGYDGLVVTDWGALNDDFVARRSGLDLEMPGIGKRYKNLQRGIKKEWLSEGDVDVCVNNIYRLHERVKNLQYTDGCDYDSHFDLARKIAAESMVLLENDGVLPLKSLENVAILGAFASQARYQGTGSSKVNPFRLVSFLDALTKENIRCDYAPGYPMDGDKTDDDLESAAISLAERKDAVIIFAGLPDSCESEGFDREKMTLPDSHLSLIQKVAGLGRKVIVVLQGGSPFELPFSKDVNALVLSYLAGEAGGPATLDLLLGRVNPSGKLPETWPLSYRDVPSSKYFPGDGTNALYKEGLYVGYRYFDSVDAPVRYPFGYGLSYTSFVYQNLDIKYEFADEQIRYAISFDVTNIGKVQGQEIAQLYVSSHALGVYKPSHELRGFTKVSLKPNETKRVSINLGQSDLRIFDITTHEWLLEKGAYTFEIGASSRDIRLKRDISVEGAETAYLNDGELSSYYQPSHPLDIDDAAFEKVLQNKIPESGMRNRRPFTKNSTLRDIQNTLIGKIIRKAMKRMADKMTGPDVEATRKMFIESAMTMPLRGYTMSGIFSNRAIDGLVHLANRHPIRGLWLFITKG
ncbi:MAG: glycoside hydrolase family 3 C-terminal domain-containing protein, partial [Bacilli bacterium]